MAVAKVRCDNHRNTSTQPSSAPRIGRSRYDFAAAARAKLACQVDNSLWQNSHSDGQVVNRGENLWEMHMHRSRLCALVIDCNTDNLSAGASFWSHALGKKLDPSDDPANNKYVSLKTREDEMIILLQRVDHPSRVHLDMETDDVEAEVARLEKLGAKKLEKIKTWWVMEAPTGHRFCVVRPQRGELPASANQWE
jgi:predicted enzyme related to lactoylglutathione lyase